VFWADSEAKVQIAPSGSGRTALSFFSLLSGVGDCRCNQRVFPGDVVYCFICFVGRRPDLEEQTLISTSKFI